MNQKVSNFVDSLFSDIPDSKQLCELKEEVIANLLEKISDSITHGKSEEESFKNAIAELGDVSELTDSMRKASNTKVENSMLFSKQIDRKHVIGYVTASSIALFGIMTAGVLQLLLGTLFITISTLLPFIIVSAALFIYFGLTQETRHEYPMSGKRALAYSLASSIALFGLMTAGMLYFQGLQLFVVLSTLIPFVIPAAAIFIYLGLTEKSRSKMGDEWAKEWMHKWSEEWRQNYNMQNSMVRGGISGALWLFSIAIFLILILNGLWKYSWIVFIFAAGLEALIEAIFASRKGK